MPGPVTELYGVKLHSAVVRRRRLAAGSPGLALGAFSGPPWARLGMLHLACPNGSQGRFGWLTPGLRRGDPPPEGHPRRPHGVEMRPICSPGY